jgi:hypothetical protein
VRDLEPVIALIKLYDLRELRNRKRAILDRKVWGVVYVGIESLDEHVLALVFYARPDPAWHVWQKIRQRWIRRNEEGPIEGGEAA